MNLFSGLFFFLLLQVNTLNGTKNVDGCVHFRRHSRKMVFVRITLDPLKYPEHT